MIPTHIVIHCSDSPFGDAALIDGWHRQNGWASIGYHFVILNGRRTNSTDYIEAADGMVELGRRESVAGAHAKGMNRSGPGICLIGKGGLYTKNQMATLFGLLLSISQRHYIPTAQIIGHFETPHEQAKPADKRKTCPDLDMQHIRATLDRMRSAFGREILAWGG